MTSGTRGSPWGTMYTTWDGTNRIKGEQHSDPHWYRKTLYIRPSIKFDRWGNILSLTELGWVGNVVLAEGISRERIFQHNKLMSELVEFSQSQQVLADLIQFKSTLSTFEGKVEQAARLTDKLLSLPKAFKNTFKGIGKHKLKKGKIYTKLPKKPNKKREKALREVPSQWLEYWFGIAPIIGSISTFIQVFAIPWEWLPFRFKSPKASPSYSDSFVRSSGTSRQVLVGEIRVKNPNAAVLGRAGINDIFGTMWEIAPWSWAVDYFINVGDVISNLSGVFDDFEMRNVCVTTRTVADWSVREPSTDEWSDGRSLSIQRNVGFETKFYLNSTVLSSIKRISYLLSGIALSLKGK